MSSFDINTNVASLQAQQYLDTNNAFQKQTINEVTSGLRIVNSGDDAAGLAVANGYRSDEAVLTQGIQNANQGLSQLQIADGGISNISQLLDRATTLATESASGTFTGSRAVLNSEFQSVIGEINRQSQAIGLNQGGSFAQNLSVFIGGGQQSGNITAVQNGSVSVNLGSSTVDAKSLGLQGVQSIGTAGTDIGTGAPATSVSAILANTANVASEANGGFTTFTFQGPGFGNNNPVSVAVNLTGVTDANTLVTALNTAIQNAGNGSTQQATAFKNAGITASLNTDSQGRTQLTFDSSNSAFQVEAGDQVSQALLGNFSQNAALTGTDQNATVDTSVNDTLTLSVNGTALATPVTVTSNATTSKAQIVRDLNSTSEFNAVATASLNGNQLVITSKLNGSSSAVSASGALATSLGLTSATAAAASTGSSLQTQVQFNGNISSGATTFGTIGAGPITFQFQGSGLTSPANLTLTTTAGETVTQALTNLSSAVSNNVTLKAAGITLTSSTAGNALVFSSSSGGSFKVGVTGDVQNLLGGGSFISGTGNSYDYSALTAGAAYNFPVGGAAGTANLQFSINGAASSGNLVSVDLGQGDATAATVTSSTNSGTVNINNANDQLNLNINGTGVTVTLTNNAATTLGSIAAQITTAITASGASASVVGNAIVLSTTNKGAGQSIQVQAGTANTALGFSTGTAPTYGTARSGASIAAALNAAFASNSTLQAAGLVADFGVTAAGKISVTSSNGTFFRTDAYGTTAAASVTGTAGAASAATAGTADGTVAGTYAITGANDTLTVQVDGGGAQTIALTHGGARTATQVAADINGQITGATASVDGSGHVQITSSTTGTSSSIELSTATAATHAVETVPTTGPYTFVTGSADTINIKVDGGTAQTVVFAAGSTTAANAAIAINAINGGAGLVGATASASGGNLVITSNSTGATSSIQFAAGDANTLFGLIAGSNPAVTGAAGVDTAAATLGYTTNSVAGAYTGSAAAAGNVTITTGVNDTLNIGINGGTATTITLAAGANVTAATIAGEIQTQLTAGNNAVADAAVTANNGFVKINSLATGTGASVTIAAGNANTTLGFTAATTTGTAGDLGYGVVGSTFANGNTATTAPTTAVQIDSGGANQTANLSFTPITDGNDVQTVSVNALDSSGVTHSLSTILQNNATSRNGASLDSAINSINTALQQSNDSTLQSIVAVKENVGGVEQIGFLSSTASFKVSSGTTANSTGIGAQGTTVASAVTGGGNTANISTQAGALAAVTVLANSVALLGSAQAVVGRGENQFNYAINLAQSQLTNTTSAEATIRDADLAAEAASLTKAQILIQAGVAALAQANSAPQAVLKLLQ